MQKLKKMIIIIAIVILILIILLLFLIINSSTLEDSFENTDNETVTSDIYDYNNLSTELLTDKTSFYTVSKCISNYLDLLNPENSLYYGQDENGNQVKVIDDATIAEMIIQVLDKDFVEDNNITSNNLYNFVNHVEQKEIFTPLQMNILPGEVTEKYAVYGFVENTEYEFIEYLYIIVTLDIQNHTYAIQPILNQTYQNLDEIELENNNIAIEINDYNQYTIQSVTNEYIANEYLNSYKRMLLGNSELAYTYLQDEYKNERFEDNEEFSQYIQDNQNRIGMINLKQYMVELRDNYSQYVCIDDYNNYYIFQETAPMQYKVILDTYTIDLPEFTQEYNNSTEAEKVLLNIQKVFEAINQQDYAYVYEKLDETFKANNFATLQEFTNYAQENFFSQNSISAANPESQGDTYLYEITISDATGENTNTLTKTFVMQLQEGTDFVMSFSV